MSTGRDARRGDVTEQDELTDAELADGLRDIASALDGDAQLDVVGWWRADRLVTAAKARTGEVLDGAIAGLETPGERNHRDWLELDRALARYERRPRPLRVKSRRS